MHFLDKQKMIFSFLTVFSASLWTACSPASDTSERNRWNSDTVYIDIYNFQHQRNAKGLSRYLSNYPPEQNKHLAFAAQAFANIGDTTGLRQIEKFMFSQDSLVRSKAVYAAGHIKDTASLSMLYRAFEQEKSRHIKAEIMISLANIGGETEEVFLSAFNYQADKHQLLYGQMKALAKLAEKNISSYKLLPRIAGFLSSERTPDSIKYWASYYLYRSKMDITDFESDFIKVFKKTDNLYIRNNIVRAMQYTQNEKLRKFLCRLAAAPETDYRLTVSALRSIDKYDFDAVKNKIKGLFNSQNPHKASAAAEYFFRKSSESFADTLYKKALQTKYREISPILYAGALRHSDQKEKISQSIKNAYQKNDGLYRKANFLEALRYYIENYVFLKKVFRNEKNALLRYTALTGLSHIRLTKNFDSLAGKTAARDKVNLEKKYAELYKEALLSGDPALVTEAAQMLYNPLFNARELYENTFFIKQAINNARLPTEIEALKALAKTDEYLNGTPVPEFLKPEYYYELDWQKIRQIKPGQKIRIYTNKGEIEAELFINETPQTVSRFLELTKQNYFNNKPIHRVVPGFVIQSGCPRGDGWGSLSRLLRTETAGGTYREGSLGMASAGKDTESAQWFITQDHTPHLDNRYTRFGKVTKGMETLHKIVPGDRIKKIIML